VRAFIFDCLFVVKTIPNTCRIYLLELSGITFSISGGAERRPLHAVVIRMSLLPLNAARVKGVGVEVEASGPGGGILSLVSDGECTGALEHCGRAGAAYGTGQRPKPVLLFGSLVAYSELGQAKSLSPNR